MESEDHKDSHRLEYKISWKYPINFGMNSKYLNRYVLDFIDSDTLSRLPLLDFQIDALADILNWDIISTKQLSGWLFVKHKNKINWHVFLQNNQYKNLFYLMKVKNIVKKYSYVFFNPRVKKMYYNDEFISTFTSIIDWDWCVKHVPISDCIIQNNWHKINANKLSKYQLLSENILKDKRNYLNWNCVCKKPLSEKSMEENIDFIRFDIICKWQKLSESFIDKYKLHIMYNSQAVYALCRYQYLSESFILSNKKWLQIDTLCKFQDLSIDFIKQNIYWLNVNSLMENKYYNRQNTIQILKSQDRIYIIDLPIIDQQNNQKIIYCTVDTKGISY